jgi:hypothetical protein
MKLSRDFAETFFFPLFPASRHAVFFFLVPTVSQNISSALVIDSSMMMEPSKSATPNRTSNVSCIIYTDRESGKNLKGLFREPFSQGAKETCGCYVEN